MPTYPRAWFIIWTIYGTWLHGDPRGSFLDSTYPPPDDALEETNRAQLTGDVVHLTDHQRATSTFACGRVIVPGLGAMPRSTAARS